MKNTTQIPWPEFSPLAYKHDFKPATSGSKYPDVGTVEYVAITGTGRRAWSERRPMHIAEACKFGFLPVA